MYYIASLFCNPTTASLSDFGGAANTDYRFRESEVKSVNADIECLRGFDNLVKQTLQTNRANPDNYGKHLSAAYARKSLAKSGRIMRA